MSPDDKTNQLDHYIGPGIWQDKLGQVHFSIPDLLKAFDLEDTPENREECTGILMEVMKQHSPNTEIRYRKSPTDDGEDLR